MPLYRKKPIEVLAVKWNGGNMGQVEELVHRSDVWQDESPDPVQLYVWTVDGNRVRVPVGAYVVIDAKGYPYPCDAEIFEANHEMWSSR